MHKKLKYYKCSIGEGSSVLFSCTIDDNGNEVIASSMVEPDKSGAAHLKQFKDWLESYIKTKYGCDK